MHIIKSKSKSGIKERKVLKSVKLSHHQHWVQTSAKASTLYITTVMMTCMQSVDDSAGQHVQAVGAKSRFSLWQVSPVLNQMASQSDPQIIKRVNPHCLSHHMWR